MEPGIEKVTAVVLTAILAVVVILFLKNSSSFRTLLAFVSSLTLAEIYMKVGVVGLIISF